MNPLIQNIRNTARRRENWLLVVAGIVTGAVFIGLVANLYYRIWG